MKRKLRRRWADLWFTYKGQGQGWVSDDGSLMVIHVMVNTAADGYECYTHDPNYEQTDWSEQWNKFVCNEAKFMGIEACVKNAVEMLKK